MFLHGSFVTTYEYDRFDQLIRENNQVAGKTWTYSYDAGGNLTQKNEYAYTTGTLGAPLASIYYRYEDAQSKDLLTMINQDTVTSDAIGNRLSDGTWTYEWEHGRQLFGMRKNGTSIEFGYNADGLRISKTVNGIETHYEYMNGRLTEVQRGNDTLHFYYDVQGAVALTWNQTSYYYLRNMQGDITGIVNASGIKVVEYTYDAWGNILSVSGSLAATLGRLNPIRYRGYIYDEETGLYYLISRYYEPANIRWLNGDHLVSTGRGLFGLNAFQYCYNNPVNTVDESGTDAIWIQEENNVAGFGHSGAMIQDEDGEWWFFYWGPMVAGPAVLWGTDKETYLVHIDASDCNLLSADGVRKALDRYCREETDSKMRTNLEQRVEQTTSILYFQGNYTNSILEAKSVTDISNTEKYNLLINNCAQKTLQVLAASEATFLRVIFAPLPTERVIPNSIFDFIGRVARHIIG